MGAAHLINFRLLVWGIVIIPALSQGGLKTGFYSSSCPKAESIVRSTVEAHFNKDPTVTAGLLRLHFHDCFVQGCDGSILIAGASAEKTARPNAGLRGFEVIDDAKSQLEGLCPGVVSCADILALAARDAVDLSGGPSWGVPTGRRDGRISSSAEASSLPTPLDPVPTQRQKFASKGLDDHDLVTLGHIPLAKRTVFSSNIVYTTSQVLGIQTQALTKHSWHSYNLLVLKMVMAQKGWL
ncbi:peroxidase 25 [Olea europaea subsp. europaea]|uniref:peroxidase n=1 Tax=Olea europaea subsp. europaea TaxID=158383 RepID=A0A8S0V2T5_OLEEU|nr:peroxidase 25 [Olea europaea subsp. europaea]